MQNYLLSLLLPAALMAQAPTGGHPLDSKGQEQCADGKATATDPDIPMKEVPLREVKSHTPIPGKPVRYVRVPTSTTRIDQKKPYMRVYYWPPMAPEATDQSGNNNSGSSTGARRLTGGMILDPVNFATNSSEILPPASHLEAVAEWLREDPNRSVSLKGFADPRGSKAHNKKLSQRRSEAVKAELVRLGASSRQIASEGLGVKGQLKKGRTPEDHWWVSRRVEITLHSAAECAESKKSGSKIQNLVAKDETKSASKE